MSYAASALQAYARNSVATAGPERLLVMLYDRLLLDLERAHDAQLRGDRPAAHTQLVHAQDIVGELLASLDVDAWDGGPGLAALYSWLLTELVNANVSNSPAVTAACRDVVQPLRDGWAEAAAAVRTAATPLAVG